MLKDILSSDRVSQDILLQGFHCLQSNTVFYFILSSEVMENICVTKVESVYSEMIWYHFR